MFCRISDMQNKEVINICDGMRLGTVDDVEIDTCTTQVIALIIYGRSKLFGLLGHEDDIIIPWKEIEVFGEQTVLVNHPMPASHGWCGCRRKRPGTVLNGIFKDS